MILLPVMTNKFELIKCFSQLGVQSSGISSSKESVNVAFVQQIFQYSALLLLPMMMIIFRLSEFLKNKLSAIRITL